MENQCWELVKAMFFLGGGNSNIFFFKFSSRIFWGNGMDQFDGPRIFQAIFKPPTCFFFVFELFHGVHPFCKETITARCFFGCHSSDASMEKKDGPSSILG